MRFFIPLVVLFRNRYLLLEIWVDRSLDVALDAPNPSGAPHSIRTESTSEVVATVERPWLEDRISQYRNSGLKDSSSRRVGRGKHDGEVSWCVYESERSSA